MGKIIGRKNRHGFLGTKKLEQKNKTLAKLAKLAINLIGIYDCYDIYGNLVFFFNLKGNPEGKH